MCAAVMSAGVKEAAVRTNTGQVVAVIVHHPASLLEDLPLVFQLPLAWGH